MVVKKTYPKIVLLIFSSSIIFILLYSSLYYYNLKVQEQVYNDSTQQYQSQITQLLEMNAKPISVYINNDTNWDEFETFIKKKDIVWYNQIIAKEIGIYKADYMVAYNAQKEFVTHTLTAKFNEKLAMPAQAMAALDRQGLSHFYLQTPLGATEVFGASVHPSFDLHKNKTPSAGYFFVVRLLDTAYLNSLEKLTGSNIKLQNQCISPVYNSNIITSQVALTKYDGTTIGCLSFERNFEVYFENTTTILYLIVFTFFINLLLSLLLTRNWVYYPLHLIRNVLETGDKKSITELKSTTGEFRYIGNLFEENNRHKKELVDAKIKAEESDQLKSSFLANLSHEIRTPMNAINGFTDLLMTTNLTDAEKQEYLQVIDKSGKNLVSIIDDLIEMSKIDSNQITPNYSSLNLEACIHELYETIKITIPKTKKVFLRIKETTTPPNRNIITDETKFKQILTNLITNGIKYTETGVVSFGYQIDEENQQLIFQIEDTGLGITEENQKYIFDRFKRVDTDLAIREGGLGLGLAITKAYVEILQGSISLNSVLGKGSVFSFTIPLQYDRLPVLPKEPVTLVKEIHNDSSVTVLIAEDDNINFLLLQKILKLRNFNIIRALNGQEAVTICLENPSVAIVLMDIKMPVMNGFQALEIIHSFRPGLPVIAQTAYASKEDEERIFSAGFTNYITKPLNKEKLFAIMKEHLGE
ncbi:ATP-binding protein [Flavobacterium phycosphaerae]|uniref:ATP-binding protein n=1 Tax=Flavobacterium phycosphaerae TaxID=2697515 RepID=UPI00138AD1D3|nr:ATP-binding protein [Flavobacterium phycosphaerae]